MKSADIDGSTGLFLVIGDPIAHSLSPRMHNAAYAERSLNFLMAAAHISSGDLPAAIAGIRAMKIRGLACTMPHKTSLLSLVDVVDPTATRIGAINTVVNNDGVLTGYNTDWIGIQRPLEKRLSLSGRKVALLGAGGAAQAALYACIMKGAHVTVFNRTASRAAALAAPWNASVGTLSPSTSLREYEIIINTTPVGMGELEGTSPLECVGADALCEHHVVFETIYRPRATKLVQDASRRTCQVVYGYEMFLEQGAAQFELHTGISAPREVMLACL